ncbi:MAG: hypothetical protein AB1711_01260 [Thermodesulfobacteriota bacterium]
MILDSIPSFTANGLASLIGSLPLKDHEQALDMMLTYVPEIPLWLQLPVYPEERLLTQFSGKLPGVVIEGDRVYFDTASPSFEDELLAFYEDYISITEGNSPLLKSRFALGPHTGKGLAAFINRMGKLARPPYAIKGQITGPFTFLTGITDQKKRCVFYDERLHDVAVKALSLKASWQVEVLRQFKTPVFVSIDEPGLAGYGSSAFVSINRQDVINMLREMAQAIHRAGGLAAVHVCANTDWSLLMESDIDIISFDAYNYFDRFILYRPAILSFLAQGKIIAWGIVPTANPADIERESVSSLAARWKEEAQELAEDGITPAALLRQSLITPSCGTGSLSQALSERVLYLTKEVSAQLRKEFL